MQVFPLSIMKKIYCIIVVFLFQMHLMAQTWDKMYNFSTDTIIASSNSAQYAEDSFFIAAGQSSNLTVDSLTSYLAVFDYNFKLLYKKQLNWPGKYNRLAGGCNSIAKAGNSQYILTGIEQDLHTNSRTEVDQLYFYVFDSNLDSVIGKKYIDTVVSRTPNSIMVDKQGNILVTGSITSTKLLYDITEKIWYYDSTYLWVAKYNKYLNNIWSKRIASVGGPYGTKIILGHDSTSYLLSGIDYSLIDTFDENFIAKLDTSGKILWKTFLHVPYFSLYWEGHDIISLKTGGYAFISTYATEPPVSGTPTYSHYHYGKIDDAGNIVWQKHFAINDTESRGERILEMDNGDLLLLGTVSYGSTWPNTTRTDSNGNIRWYRDYQHAISYQLGQQLLNISYTPRHQLLMSGELSAQHPLLGAFDSVGGISWFVLTDTFGCTSPGCQNWDTMWHTGIASPKERLGEVSVYPNPFSTQIIIESPTQFSLQNTTATLTDVLGRLVYTTSFTQQKQTITLPNLPPGMYYLTLTEAGYKKVFKLVRE